jgi:hypothetical protein
MPFCLVCMIDKILLPFDILSTSSLHGITKASLVLLLLRSSVQGVYCITSLYTQGVASLALVYEHSATALSGRYW